MAKCGHCNNMGTRLEIIEPTTAAYKLGAVVCSSCSSILGVTEFQNNGALHAKADKKMDALKSQVSNLETQLRNILQILNRR